MFASINDGITTKQLNIEIIQISRNRSYEEK